MLSLKHALIVALLAAAALEAGYYISRRAPEAPIPEAPIMNATSSPSSSPATAPEKQTKPVLKIGVILPLTGIQGVYGQAIKEGLDLSADGVNATDKFTLRVHLVYEDTASNVKNAPGAAQKLINRDRVTALISALSPNSLAVAPIAEKNKIPLLTMASLATKLDTAGDFVFKNDDHASTLGEGLARAARKKNIRTVSTLFAGYNDSPVEAHEAFAKTFVAEDGRVLQQEGFASQDTTDFKTLLLKLIAPKPDAVAIFGLQRDCALSIKQLRELGYAGQILGFTCMDDPQVLDVAGSATEGALFASFNPVLSPHFVDLVITKYGHEPLRWTAEAFDGLKLMAIAAARAQEIAPPLTSRSLRDALSGITGSTGEAGHADFDKQGNAKRKLYIKTITNGKIEVVQ